MAGDDSNTTITALRDALAVSPDNLPLRRHLAELLAGFGRHDEAAAEYRQAIRLAPQDADLRLALSRCFIALGKLGEALVILEQLTAEPRVTPQTRVVYARVLVERGEQDKAAAQYRRAIDEDPEQVDEALGETLGVTPGGGWREGMDDAFDDDPFGGRQPAARGDEPGDAAHIEVERPKIDFEQVGGMDAIKEEVRVKIIHPLTHPEIYKAYGKAIGGGILMYGPPGCGKTHLARATAGEVKAAFMSVGIHDVLDMWIGNSEKQLHELFQTARRNQPSVLFFDEVDALGASRTDMRSSGGRHLINQFLAELDGSQASNDGVLVLAATNAPWHLDPAFRRPGRFDRVLFVPPPDASARAAILRVMLDGKPTESIDHAHLAKKTDRFSGADLKAVVDLAIEAKLRDAMSEGVPKPLTTKDLARAAGRVKPSTAEWFATARNYALYANQSGAYDEILSYLNIKR